MKWAEQLGNNEHPLSPALVSKGIYLQRDWLVSIREVSWQRRNEGSKPGTELAENLGAPAIKALLGKPLCQAISLPKSSSVAKLSMAAHSKLRP
jgi:hypothetical protein